MNVQKLGAEIMDSIGGPENVKEIMHCATRLRVVLKDDSKFDSEKVQKIIGVLGVAQFDDQHQIIIGPGVNHLYKTILKNYEFVNIKKDQVEKAGKKNIFNVILTYISSSIAPVVPAITAAGFIKVLLMLLSMAGVLSTDSQTYQFIDIFASVVFDFMPLFVAYTLAEKLECNKIISAALVAVLIYPAFTTLIGTGGAKLFGIIPVAASSYSGSIGPALLTVYVLSLVEKWLNKIIPDLLRAILVPLCSVLIVGLLMITAIAPIGYYIGYIFVWLFETFYDTAGWLVIGLLCAFSPFLGMTGMHLALFPIAVNVLGTVGYEKVVLNTFFISTIANGIAALAVFFKTKKPELKKIAGSSAFTTLVGSVGEPSLFAVVARLKKPIYAVMIGSASAGLVAGLLGLKAFTFGAYSVFTIPAFINSGYPTNVYIACVVAAVAIVVTFAATWIIGFDDSEFN